MKYIYLSLITLFLVSCSQNSKKRSANESNNKVEAEVSYEDAFSELVAAMKDNKDEDLQGVNEEGDTASIPMSSYSFDSIPNENFIIIKLIEDGPDYSWVSEVVSGGELIDSSVAKCVQLVPAHNPEVSSFKSLLWFLTMDMQFTYDESLKDYTGLVSVYNDTAATDRIGFVSMYKGKPHGKVVVINDAGNIVIDRNYYNGNWLSSDEDLACVDWSFNAENSNIEIKDTQRISNFEDINIIELLPSKHPNGYNSWMYQIIDKETFKNPIRVNGNIFTGTLIGYFEASYSTTDLIKHFELEIVNGKLHGLIYVYNEWNELVLKEVFYDGVLKETLFKAEEQDGVAKPIIYMYPTDTISINVSLDFKGTLTHTYPQYPQNGWNVTAYPDGTLIDSTGLEYYSLFWEGNNDKEFSVHEANVVAGNKTRVFLEQSLATLGLNRREANEFIIYWLPLMENNKYNLIHFSTKEYEEMAELKITPKPETLIRVMMVWQPLSENTSVTLQDISLLSKTRKGFTVVEWGGKRLSENTVMSFVK